MHPFFNETETFLGHLDYHESRGQQLNKQETKKNLAVFLYDWRRVWG